MTLISSAMSATVRASGPLTEKPSSGNDVGHVGVRPTLGRKPTMLLKLPGLRSEPARSLPSAIGIMPRCERRAGAAARAAGALRQVVRVQRRAVHLVDRCASPCRTRARWSCRSGSRRRARSRVDEHGVLGRHRVLVDQRAARVREADGRLQILEGGRQAVQRRQLAATRQACVGGIGEREALVVVELGDDRIELRDSRGRCARGARP